MLFLEITQNHSGLTWLHLAGYLVAEMIRIVTNLALRFRCLPLCPKFSLWTERNCAVGEKAAHVRMQTNSAFSHFKIAYLFIFNDLFSFERSKFTSQIRFCSYGVAFFTFFYQTKKIHK